jgi:dihydroorotate dehydrogenase
MDLSSGYMGLALRNPLVASASPLSQAVDGVRRLADAGVGAVVLYSLCEERLHQEAAQNARLVEAGIRLREGGCPHEVTDRLAVAGERVVPSGRYPWFWCSRMARQRFVR